jgi:hypothetical protein
MKHTVSISSKKLQDVFPVFKRNASISCFTPFELPVGGSQDSYALEEEVKKAPSPEQGNAPGCTLPLVLSMLAVVIARVPVVYYYAGPCASAQRTIKILKCKY